MAFVQQHFLGCQFATVADKVKRLLALTLPEQFEAEYRQQLLSEFERNLTVTDGIRSILADLKVPYC
ncbi:hypothetical protein, partial [Psychrobacter sp. CAL606-MNA-CIBAN-0158]